MNEKLKEILLQKGISPEIADQVVSEASGVEKSTPLVALNKALKGAEEAENTLFKAEDHKEPDGDEGKGGDGDGVGDEGKDEDYDEEYMKKYMKKYMKANKKACQKAAEEAGLFEEKLNKAVDDINFANDGAVVEMEDLSAYLKANTQFNKSMLKAVFAIAEKVELISSQNVETFGLMRKAAEVQYVTAEAIGSALSASTGRKGVTSAQASASMEKARSTGAAPANNRQLVYQALAKAMNAGDEKAGLILSEFESCGQKIEALNTMQKQYVNELLTKKEA